ncbi:RILP-like protein 2 [Pristis pectinata]|uniref:RILP-like protein 2 n=1 Tax=Pristis pectinata TaxID=685728 RepID=UPI00223DFC81|nr:RILP-like protein 2 [Pristis pectinata]XP_051900936.1 RILP-like protein 2 [Pristis pectinata]
MEELDPASAFDKDPFELTAENVYDISYIIGRDLIQFSSSEGCNRVSELQYKIIRVLEMLECLVNKHNLTVETLKIERDNLRTETERLSRELQQAVSNSKQNIGPGKLVVDIDDPDRPRFTLQELRDVLHERNKLKAQLHVAQEELECYKNGIIGTKESQPVKISESGPSAGSEQTMIKKLFSLRHKKTP